MNYRFKAGLTPLMFAAENNTNLSSLNLLIEKGADVKARYDRGWTSLIYACVDILPALKVQGRGFLKETCEVVI